MCPFDVGRCLPRSFEGQSLLARQPKEVAILMPFFRSACQFKALARRGSVAISRARVTPSLVKSKHPCSSDGHPPFPSYSTINTVSSARSNMPMSVPLRNELQSGKTAFGIWNTLPGTALVRTIASTPGISVRVPFFFLGA